MKLPPTDPDRYGWRFWGLNPDGALVSPFLGTWVASATFEAQCTACGGEAPAPDCGCGVHYLPRTEDLFEGTPSCWFLRPGYKPWQDEAKMQRHTPALYRMLKGHLPFVLTYGVALGGVEVDKQMVRVLRSRKWHVLSMLLGAPAAAAGQRGWSSSPRALAGRYGCQVRPGVSLEACQAVRQRLVSSLSADQMAELAERPAAASVLPSPIVAGLNTLSVREIAGLMSDPFINRLVVEKR